MFVITPPYLFFVWIFHGVLGRYSFLARVWYLFCWWAMMNLGGFLTAVVIGGALMRFVSDMLYQTRREYYLWRQAGGDPFWDILPWPINTDSNKVRMAITAPPDYDFCPHDGFPVGRRFGNQCRACGTFHDKG